MLTKTKTSIGFGFSLNGRPVGYIQTGTTTRTDVVPARVGLTNGPVLAYVFTPQQAAKIGHNGTEYCNGVPVLVGTMADAEAILARAVGV